MKLFTGDTGGRVVCTEIDYTTVSLLYCLHCVKILKLNTVTPFLCEILGNFLTNSQNFI